MKQHPNPDTKGKRPSELVLERALSRGTVSRCSSESHLRKSVARAIEPLSDPIGGPPRFPVRAPAAKPTRTTSSICAAATLPPVLAESPPQERRGRPNPLRASDRPAGQVSPTISDPDDQSVLESQRRAEWLGPPPKKSEPRRRLSDPEPSPTTKPADPPRPQDSPSAMRRSLVMSRHESGVFERKSPGTRDQQPSKRPAEQSPKEKAVDHRQSPEQPPSDSPTAKVPKSPRLLKEESAVIPRSRATEERPKTPENRRKTAASGNKPKSPRERLQQQQPLKPKSPKALKEEFAVAPKKPSSIARKESIVLPKKPGSPRQLTVADLDCSPPPINSPSEGMAAAVPAKLPTEWTKAAEEPRKSPREVPVFVLAAAIPSSVSVARAQELSSVAQSPGKSAAKPEQQGSSRQQKVPASSPVATPKKVAQTFAPVTLGAPAANPQASADPAGWLLASDSPPNEAPSPSPPAAMSPRKPQVQEAPRESPRLRTPPRFPIPSDPGPPPPPPPQQQQQQVDEAEKPEVFDDEVIGEITPRTPEESPRPPPPSVNPEEPDEAALGRTGGNDGDDEDVKEEEGRADATSSSQVLGVPPRRPRGKARAPTRNPLKGASTVPALPTAQVEIEQRTDVVVHTQAVPLGGFHVVSHPFSPGARQALSEFSSGRWNLVVLQIDGKEVALDKAANIEIGDLPSHINSKEPRFYLHHWAHGLKQFTIFIYCCPPSAPVKTRMVYPTAKQAVVKDAEAFGISIDKRMEVRDSEDVTDASLIEDIIEAPAAAAAQAASPSRAPLASANSAPPDLLARIARIGKRL